MGFSSLQLNVFTLKRQQTQVNRQLMELEDQQTMLATQSSNIRNTKEDWYKDNTYKTVEAQQNQLDLDIKTFETQLDAITENLKKIEEQRDENAKDVPKLT